MSKDCDGGAQIDELRADLAELRSTLPEQKQELAEMRGDVVEQEHRTLPILRNFSLERRT